MGENSKIEWTDHTFNLWIGCQHVSPGCDHCYAEAMMDHRYGKVEWGPHGERKRTSEANWKKPLKWNVEARALMMLLLARSQLVRRSPKHAEHWPSNSSDLPNLWQSHSIRGLGT